MSTAGKKDAKPAVTKLSFDDLTKLDLMKDKQINDYFQSMQWD